MRKLPRLLLIMCLASPLFGGTAVAREENLTTLNFAVMRNGEQIGSTTVRLQRKDDQTIVELATAIAVKIGFLTVYRFEQRQTEHWVGHSLAALNSVTDDNGSVHQVSARRTGNKLSVNADGKLSVVDSAVIPANLWNASLMRTTLALNPKDGTVMQVSVVDRGKEQLVLQGRATTAHRYSIKTTIPQEVWYDEQHRLLRVELRGSDGSKIHYQLS